MDEEDADYADAAPVPRRRTTARPVSDFEEDQFDDFRIRKLRIWLNIVLLLAVVFYFGCCSATHQIVWVFVTGFAGIVCLYSLVRQLNSYFARAGLLVNHVGRLDYQLAKIRELDLETQDDESSHEEFHDEGERLTEGEHTQEGFPFGDFSQEPDKPASSPAVPHYGSEVPMGDYNSLP